jgi:hypothetical protein
MKEISQSVQIKATVMAGQKYRLKKEKEERIKT